MPHDDALPTEPPRRVNGQRFPNPHRLPMFPLVPNDKGVHEVGARDRADPDAEIPPGYNAGVRTGGGLLVLDFDKKKGGCDSYTKLTVFDRLPATWLPGLPALIRAAYPA